MAAERKRATRAVTGLLLEANWKEHTAEIYPDTGPAVTVAFSEELSDAIQRAARRRVRVTGKATREGAGGERLRVDKLEVLDIPVGPAGLLEAAADAPVARDPFAGAKPLENVWDLFPPLPDGRSAEEIIADIRAYRVPHQEEDE